MVSDVAKIGLFMKKNKRIRGKWDVSAERWDIMVRCYDVMFLYFRMASWVLPLVSMMPEAL